jgi:hypothetical protein
VGTYAKTWVQAAATVLAAVLPALNGTLTVAGWINVVILAAGAVHVYNAPNLPGWPYAKLVASGISAVAVAVLTFLDTNGPITTGNAVQLVLACAAALSVGVVPNRSPAPTGRHEKA